MTFSSLADDRARETSDIIDGHASYARARQIRTCAIPKIPISEWVITFLVIALSGAVFWHNAATSARIDAVNYQITELQTQTRQLAVDNAWLSAKVDELSRPARILQIAQGTLHMSFAAPLQVQPWSASAPNLKP